MTASPDADRDRLRRALVQSLESFAQAGVEVVRRRSVRAAAAAPARPAARGPVPTAAAEPVAPATAASAPSPDRSRGLFEPAEAPQAAAILPVEQRGEALELLRAEVAACTRCRELVEYRTQTVFGVGNLAPRLCFFGEAPGADEDRQGEPFVGRAGQLLNDIIRAIGMRREDVYILNVLKCRPPNNRTPTADEAAHCRPFFERQLEILRPEWICCLGLPATTALLGPVPSLGKMRGRIHQFRWAKVVVTYHPAYLLRNPAAKRDTWEDMKMLLGGMGLPVPEHRKSS